MILPGEQHQAWISAAFCKLTPIRSVPVTGKPEFINENTGMLGVGMVYQNRR
jgi:hypothetical protein